MLPRTEAGRRLLAIVAAAVDGRDNDETMTVDVSWLWTLTHAIDAIEAEAREMTGTEAVNLRVGRIEAEAITNALDALAAEVAGLYGTFHPMCAVEDEPTDREVVSRKAVLAAIEKAKAYREDTDVRLDEPHPIWPEGPDCDEQCPGKWSQYHDGFAWGVEKERARIRAAVEGLRVRANVRHETPWQEGFRQSRNETVAAVLAIIDDDA